MALDYNRRVQTALANLDAAFHELRAAIEAASEAWQQAPAPGEWPPRLAAEHILSAAVVYLEFAADELRRPAFDWQSLSYDLPSARDALEALALVSEYAALVFQGLTEEALDIEVPAMGDWPDLPCTVEGALRQVERHTRMHARQIREAGSG